MTMSESGRKKLAEWEGVRLTLYKDVAGYPTIGVGHLLTKDEISSGKIEITIIDVYGSCVIPNSGIRIRSAIFNGTALHVKCSTSNIYQISVFEKGGVKYIK